MVRGPAGGFYTLQGELLTPPPAHSELMDLLGNPMDAPPATEVMPGVRTGPIPLIKKE